MTETEKRGVDALEKIAKRLWWIALWLGAILWVLTLWGMNARADSTKVFQAIEKPRVTCAERERLLDSLLAHIRFERGWIVIDCPVKFGNDSEYVMLGFGGMSAQKAKITVKQPPLNIPVVRARGLDSVYTLPHDSTFRNADGFLVDLKIPGAWWYYDWKNGKRTNLRSVR